MFHFPNVGWTALQAKAMGLPQVTEETAGIKEEELTDLKTALGKAKEAFGLEGVCTGALASVYQKARVESICRDLDLDCLSPLWGIDQEVHLRTMVNQGFVATVVSVSAMGLGQEWLGRTLDADAVDDLVALGRRFRFNVGLEGGEGETFVLDAPSFAKRIEIVSAVKHWSGDSGFLEITEASLVPKG